MKIAIVKVPENVVGLLPILYFLAFPVTIQILTCDHSLSYIFMCCANDLNVIFIVKSLKNKKQQVKEKE